MTDGDEGNKRCDSRLRGACGAVGGLVNVCPEEGATAVWDNVPGRGEPAAAHNQKIKKMITV